jgi:hypothetical protein
LAIAITENNLGEIFMNRTVRIFILFISTLLLGGMAASTYAAEGQFNKNHPRRAQVNKRLNNQDKRINKEVKEGEITKSQAAKLHKNDRQIRKEERAMASQNGGHITKQEQKTLNQQENANSKQIGK